MKLNGIVGKGSGKLGASVFAISGGEQIVRQYNPQVSNPSTDAQVEQRAKLKLMSQLAAALADVIVFKKQGLISKRNLFVKSNIGLCTFADNSASVELASLKLTDGVAKAGKMIVSTRVNNAYQCYLDDVTPGAWDRVIWVGCETTVDEKLRVVSIQQAEEGANHNFAANVSVPDSGSVIYAYGVKFTNAAAKARYENYFVGAEESDADLAVILSNSLLNATVSASEGVNVPAE